MILREKGFAAVVILTLAIGIGANTAIFTVVNSVLLRPLEYRAPERLVALNEVVPKFVQMYPKLPVNLSHYFDWRNQSKSFESIALFRPRTMNLTGAGEPVMLRSASVSANVLEVLGVSPVLGRSFREGEDREGQNRVVILSHALWTERFHSDPGVIGRKVLLDDDPHVVVGVMPSGFRLPFGGLFGAGGLAEDTQVFRPVGYSNDDLKERVGTFNWVAVGRLRPGVTPGQALSELNVIQAGISSTLEEKMELRGAVTPLLDTVVGDSRRGLLVVMGAVGAVLLILCVNLANLWFARAAGRNRELAIRVALGASRARLVQHMLTESMALAVLGGAIGVGLAYAATGALLRFAPTDLPRLSEVRMDGTALLFAVAVSVLAGALFGILPALRTARQDPQESLKSASYTNTESTRGVRVRKVLVAAEVGLSTVLLITAGLLIRSFERLMTVDRGFDVERVLAVDATLPVKHYAKGEDRSEFFRRLIDKAKAMPGVLTASIVSALPLSGETWIDLVGTEHDTRPLFERPSVNVRFISPDYFKTIRAPLRAGRTFEDRDRTRQVAIISAAVARKLWPGEDAVGRKMQHNDKLVEVVGVTADLRSTSLDKQPASMLYVPYWQQPRFAASLLVRSAGDPHTLGAAMRHSISELDPEVPVPAIRTLVEVMNTSVAQRRFSMMLVMVFALSAIGLASFGVYGVLAYSVARRRTEIGIRMALGARLADVRTMVVRQGLAPVMAGLLAGIVGSLLTGKVLTSMLFEVSERDPLTIVSVAAVLSAVAVAACLVPAVRATRINPITALRCE